MELAALQHYPSPPFGHRPSTCSFRSITSTRNPNRRSCSCLFTWMGRGFCPGAFSSTNTATPPGRRHSRSGMPISVGSNLRQRPPFCRTALRRYCSISFSRSRDHLPFHFSLPIRNTDGVIFFRSWEKGDSRTTHPSDGPFLGWSFSRARWNYLQFPILLYII